MGGCCEIKKEHIQLDFNKSQILGNKEPKTNRGNKIFIQYLKGELSIYDIGQKCKNCQIYPEFRSILYRIFLDITPQFQKFEISPYSILYKKYPKFFIDNT